LYFWKYFIIMDNLNIDYFTARLIDFGMLVGPKLILAIFTLIIGLWAINVGVGVFRRLLLKKAKDPSLSVFLTKLINITFKILLIISVAGMIGIETTSFIAVLGAAGLAVGLALQGSLANFAGGVLILFFKPFKVGDFIEGQDKMGTVEAIDILHTVLMAPDNKIIIIPNGQLANSPITNFTKMESRRIEFAVRISYGSDIKKARQVIMGVFMMDERILKEPAPIVVFTEFGDSSLNLTVRAWAKTSDFWPVYWECMEKIKEEFEKSEIEIPFPQRDVHLYDNKK
jgi:small conductance mechanosensitive channel